MKKSLLFFVSCVLIVFSIQAQQRPTIKSTVFKKDTFSITKFGAISNEVTLNHKAIQAAIDACNKKGGGVVLVPKGFWLTGPIVLKSNVNLHLQHNALLQFTADKSQYPLVETNWEGLPAVRNASPISATNATNIAITGHGIIDGNGDVWRAVKKGKLTDSQWKKLLANGGVLSNDKKVWYPSEDYARGDTTKKAGVLFNGKTAEDYKNIKDFLRPNLLVLTRCNRILLEGVTFQNSAAWCLHPLMSTHLTVRNITVKNPWYAQNGDGIDVESCRYVLIENSVFDVGDDGLCIKSGRDEEGRKRAMPTQDVIIKNCTVYNAHGGFVIGSEMSGGAKNIFVDDCTFVGSDIGLRFKTTRGRGGIVENIFINNINMQNIPGEAILFDMYYMAKDPIVLEGEAREAPKVTFEPITDATPQFKNIYIKNVVCNGAEKALFIRGLPEMNIQNIQIENFMANTKQGIQINEAKNISLKNIQVNASKPGPLVDIVNSQLLQFYSFNKEGQAAIKVAGNRSANIIWQNSAVIDTSKSVFEFGSTPNVIQVK
ncbi:MAG TPA: glycoside hydrolase family 28 protein [Ferruginibacter sp.]|nr:glycoside hydrolase family 28 protein [Ferruginibacter sp.]HRE63274.1 glycoside hydrolase family 28 protein [Ferruginibacter sp.]